MVAARALLAETTVVLVLFNRGTGHKRSIWERRPWKKYHARGRIVCAVYDIDEETNMPRRAGSLLYGICLFYDA